MQRRAAPPVAHAHIGAREGGWARAFACGYTHWHVWRGVHWQPVGRRSVGEHVGELGDHVLGRADVVLQHESVIAAVFHAEGEHTGVVTPFVGEPVRFGRLVGGEGGALRHQIEKRGELHGTGVRLILEMNDEQYAEKQFFLVGADLIENGLGRLSDVGSMSSGCCRDGKAYWCRLRSFRRCIWSSLNFLDLIFQPPLCLKMFCNVRLVQTFILRLVSNEACRIRLVTK